MIYTFHTCHVDCHITKKKRSVFVGDQRSFEVIGGEGIKKTVNRLKASYLKMAIVSIFHTEYIDLSHCGNRFIILRGRFLLFSWRSEVV